jgi:hypothetical protein
MAVLNSSNPPLGHRGLKKLFRICLVLSALFFSGSRALPAQTEISREYQVKAVFLFNFAQFVEWPTNVLSDTQAPLTIGVLGDDPFDGFLDDTVRGEKVDGHPLAIQRYRNVEDVKNCQILFISRSEGKRMEEILAALKGKNILTVSDSEGFINNGGVIRFVTEENKIHFRISLEAAKNANLTISSKMLRLAKIVEPGKD